MFKNLFLAEEPISGRKKIENVSQKCIYRNPT